MSHRLHRSLGSLPTKAVSAHGLYVRDDAGNEYIDSSGGAAVMALGHGDRRVLSAMHQQLDIMHYAHAPSFTHDPGEKLATRLAALAPASLNHVYFASGGSEAVESALKLARQYFVEIGQPERVNIIGRWHGLHGGSLGALGAGGFHRRRAAYAPLLSEKMHHISPCYPYRLQRERESAEEYGLRAADLLEAEVQRLGPSTVAVFIAETVVGSTLGTVAAPPSYFTRIREICDRHGILLILDEVMCGAGRTGTFFAFEQEGIVPDIVVTAKALSAGYFPLGATLTADHIVEALRDGSGIVAHGYTHEANPVGCAAALAVLDVLEEDGLLERVQKLGVKFHDLLIERVGSHPHVGDVRGRGLFQSIELVKDRASQAVFPPEDGLAARLAVDARTRGLLFYAEACYVDPSGANEFGGDVGDHIILCPAFTTTDDELATIVELVGQTIDSVLEPVGSERVQTGTASA